jgi:hypothetical protein
VVRFNGWHDTRAQLVADQVVAACSVAVAASDWDSCFRSHRYPCVQNRPFEIGAPGEIRTPDLLVRRQKCYCTQVPVAPAESGPAPVAYIQQLPAPKPLFGLGRRMQYSTPFGGLNRDNSVSSRECELRWVGGTAAIERRYLSTGVRGWLGFPRAPPVRHAVIDKGY